MTTSNKIKIFSKTGIAPKYKTSGASGFDICYKYINRITTNVSLNSLVLNIITDLKKHRGINLSRKDYNLLLSKETYDDIINIYTYYPIAPYSISKSNFVTSLIYAIVDKYKDVIEGNVPYTNDNKSHWILPYSHNVLQTGLYVELPNDYELQLRPRSGISAKTNLITMLGTIDSDYRGEIGIIIHNPTPFTYIIEDGERLGQLVLSKVDKLEIEMVDSLEELNSTTRGDKGFGSTGIK